MTFTIEGQPQGKGRPRFTKNGHAFTPQATRDYENLIAESFKAAGGELFDGYVCVNISAFYKIPQATTKVKRGMIERGFLKPAVKPDIDNVLKVVLDALNGVAYKDDSRVVSVTARKVYSFEPKIVIEMRGSD